MSKLRKIVLYGHPSLRKPVATANPEDSATRAVANALRARLSTIEGYGLTANQLGFDTQVFCYRPKSRGKFVTVLNPTIVEESDDVFTFREGCLSIPNFWWDIDRPRSLCLRGIDLGGNEIEIEAEETHARILQHEIDHFNGRLVIDHLPPEQLLQFKAEWYALTGYFEETGEDDE